MLLLADTGLRPGEACAIQWDDLDGTNRTLRIARSVENSGRVKTIKTDKSRTVDLSARLTSALIAFQASLGGRRDGRRQGHDRAASLCDEARHTPKATTAREGVQEGGEGGGAAPRALPLLPAPYLRQPSDRGRRADHLYRRAGRSLEGDNDPHLLRTPLPERRPSPRGPDGAGAARCDTVADSRTSA